MTPIAFPHTTLSSPAKAGDPVRRGSSALSLLSLEYWVTRLREGFAEVGCFSRCRMAREQQGFWVFCLKCLSVVVQVACGVILAHRWILIAAAASWNAVALRRRP